MLASIGGVSDSDNLVLLVAQCNLTLHHHLSIWVERNESLALTTLGFK